jgi:RNA polymerase sigma factor (sigma-70 family)
LRVTQRSACQRVHRLRSCGDSGQSHDRPDLRLLRHWTQDLVVVGPSRIESAGPHAELLMTIPDAFGRDPGDPPAARPRFVISRGATDVQRGDPLSPVSCDADDDHATIDAIRRGDEVVYERVFREHYVALATFADRYLHDAEAAEDVAQETLGALWIDRATLERSTGLTSYLYAGTRHRAIALQNQREKDNVAPAAYDDPLAVAEDVPSAGERLIVVERVEAMRRAILQLPATRRTAFQLRIGAALPYAHIAELLQTTVRNVELLIRRASRSLRASAQ